MDLFLRGADFVSRLGRRLHSRVLRVELVAHWESEVRGVRDDHPATVPE